MISPSVIAAVLALAIVEPRDGATVPLLKAEHRAYLAGSRQERFRRMDTPAERVKLFRSGSRQEALKFSWTGDTNATHFLEFDISEGGERQEFAIPKLTSVYLTNLKLGRRYRWRIRNESGESAEGEFATETLAPRLLRAEGVGNFRDLGGWTTLSGRRVRQDRIYRCAGLRSSSKAKGSLFRQKVELGDRRVTEAGLETLRGEFKIRTDLELRTTRETAGMNSSLIGADVRWVNIPFAAYDFIDGRERGREPFAKIFRELLDESHYPVLCHCSGGRDRTGTLAFLLNAILGVGEDDLCRDWEVSIFSDSSVSFSSDRITRLVSYLKTLPGKNVNDQAESYAKFCGITDDEIKKFRRMMLE